MSVISDSSFRFLNPVSSIGVKLLFVGVLGDAFDLVAEIFGAEMSVITAQTTFSRN